jgi:histone H3/H4
MPMDTQAQTSWRRCSNCKNEIALNAKYWMCSVQSCSKARAPVQFCSPDCWAVHNEVENHKNAWAVEHLAPKTHDVVESKPPAPAASSAPKAAPSSTAPRPASAPATSSASAGPSPAARVDGGEVLIVVSRLKEFIREKSNGMSTSDQVVGPLSDKVRKLTDSAIASARTNSRKTVLDRDLARPPASPDIKSTDVLIVVSKLKEYVRAQSDLRTSDELPVVLSEEVRRVCLFAIENARKDGRKTVMGRDIP